MAVKIGMMSFAHMHSSSYAACINQMPQAEMVGIADHDPERGQKIAHQFKTKYFPSYQALVEADIDAVVIGSENIRHRELAEMAAE
ncbi:MAG TPA: Gfo/Idh/MocA family oxidoreductase, partial [Armatimonadota bacterium]|nr:Gfo/Idh/MocA family oxidoreductase [Armatimonadota bacterium]